MDDKRPKVHRASNVESERNVLKLDSPTLKRKTDQFDSLSKKIKNLQDELSEKTERISALEVENEVLRKGTGDGIGVYQDGPMVKELQKMVDARNTYIQQLSDSLQKRSEELQASILREKQLAEETQNLQQHVSALTKQTELKLSEAYSESVEYKAKVELMSSQILEYSILVQSLRATLENNNKEMIAKKEELDRKEKKLEEYKTVVSEDVKTLMGQIETLNYELSRKEKDLVKNKTDVELLKSKLEEQFGAEIRALKAKLENKYAEDIKKVETLYDGMLLDHIRKSDHQLQTVKQNSNLEDEMKAMRENYERDINKYKEELNALVLKSKATEDKLSLELEKYKQEADHYKQQVENIENKVAEEVRKIQRDCFKELDQYECEVKQEQNKYEIEIQKLGKRLRDIAIFEATKEVELESCKTELAKLQQYVHKMEEKFKLCSDDYERQKSKLITQISQFQENESKLMKELKISRLKLLEYENKVFEFNENFKDQSSDFNEKYKIVIKTFEEQIQNLMNELERTKAFYEVEGSRYTSVINEKENLIKNLEAKLNYLSILISNKGNENSTMGESFSDQDSVKELVEQINTWKNNLMLAEKYEKSNKDFLFKALGALKEVKTFVNKISGNNVEGNPQDTTNFKNTDGKGDYDNITKELEKTINDIVNITQSVNERELSGPSKFSSIYTSTPRVNANKDYFSDPSYMKNDPGDDLIRKCELLEAENIKLTGKLELLTAHLKEMEYCLYVTSKESLIFDEKCKDLDSKITELETLKFSEFMLKKENNELKERFMNLEESEKFVRKELAELVDKNINLEKTLNKIVTNLQEEVADRGPNINLEAVLSDFKAKSDEVVRLRSQLSAVQNALKDNQEKMMQLKARCDKFIAEHDFMMSEINTKQKELEEVWKERNELSTENKMLQSKLLSVRGNSPLQLHRIPSTVRSSTSTMDNDIYMPDKEPEVHKMRVHETDDDFNDIHLKRLQTMHLLTESIALSSRTSMMNESLSSLSVSSRIDLELQQLDEMFDEPDNLYMPTITEEDEDYSDEVRVFFQQMAQGDQLSEGKEKVDPM